MVEWLVLDQVIMERSRATPTAAEFRLVVVEVCAAAAVRSVDVVHGMYHAVTADARRGVVDVRTATA